MGRDTSNKDFKVIELRRSVGKWWRKSESDTPSGRNKSRRTGKI